MEKFQFLKKISRKFRDFFKDFLNFYRIIGENLDTNVKDLEICICKGFGGAEPPDASEFMEI